ncbi:MAG TPA: Xaa-Pro peptidase family protein [Gemmatimonadales bacterium]
MSTNRRDFLLKGGYSLAALGSFKFSTLEAVAQGAVSPESLGLALDATSQSRKPFRLTEPWYRQTVSRFQQRIGERGLRGMILSSVLNYNYLTGYFMGGWERPAWLFVPTEGEPTMFFCGIDRENLTPWWIKDLEWYYDYKHAGPFNQTVFEAGPEVDLTQWMLSGLGKRGFGEGRIGIERELTASEHRRWTAVLPRGEFVEAGSIPLRMRMVKTPEEIALTQVAIDYHDKALQYAHDLIATKAPGIGDWEVRRQTAAYIEDVVFSEFQVDGRPNNGVGIRLGLGCRAGRATAYTHPNMYFRKVIERGDAVQISGGQRIGGYGGEGYRAMHLEPIPPLARRLWETCTEMTIAQVELSKPGRECRQVAEDMLKIVRRAGLEKYVYHRPAHGEGVEGHQPPWISLGDDTVLQEGMMFSNEPALYNPEGGYGYNHSNNIVITQTGARVMNKLPLNKEFCWIKV